MESQNCRSLGKIFSRCSRQKIALAKNFSADFKRENTEFNKGTIIFTVAKWPLEIFGLETG